MSKRAEKRGLQALPPRWRKTKDGKGKIDSALPVRKFYIRAYEQAEKDTIERAVAWLEETFFDNSHHSGRGSYGQIETNDFDSMEEMIEKFKKAMEKE